MTRLPRSRLSKRNGMNKNRYKHFSQPVETKIMRMCMYQFKLTESLTKTLTKTYFYHMVMNTCLVWRDGTDFIQTQKYIIPLTYRDIFSVKTPS